MIFGKNNRLYYFLADLHILPQNINGKDYLFVHKHATKDPSKQSKKGYKFKELTDQYTFMLEERDNSTYEQAMDYNDMWTYLNCRNFNRW